MSRILPADGAPLNARALSWANRDGDVWYPVGPGSVETVLPGLMDAFGADVARAGWIEIENGGERN
jgi:hypothetical protein